MASLKSIAQVNYDTVYPNASVQTSVKVEHFIEEAKIRYAWEQWRLSKELKRAEGEWEVPSVLLRDADLPIENDVADLSTLNIFRSFDGDVWLANVGGIVSDCNYIRLTVANKGILLDDEYLGNSKPYIISGNQIKFPKGAHKKTIPITYASNGGDVDEDIDVDDAIAALVSEYLYKRFSGKLPEDRTADGRGDK